MGRPDPGNGLRGMDQNDHIAITALFERLARVEASGPPRDPEAQALIDAAMRSQPGAAYYLAQTVLAQEQALKAAEARIRALEAQAESGFFSGWFPDPQPKMQTGQPGFLAGAAQTALGVAGGVFLAGTLADLMGEAETEGSEADDEGSWW